MNERINAVSRTFWTLLAVALVVTAIGIPIGDDGNTMTVVDELSTFVHGFDRAALERTLLAHASRQGLVEIDAVARSVQGRGVPKVSAAAGARPIAPRAEIALVTLSDVRALTAHGALVPIAAPRAEQLGAALSWRLARQPSAERYELVGIALGAAGCSAALVDLERQVTRAREQLLDVRARDAQAQKQFDDADQLLDLRRKWKAPWKAISRADEKRIETQTALTAAKHELAEAERSYEALAKRAESFPSTTATKPTSKGSEACAVATASLVERPSGRAFELKLPASIERRGVPVPRITGADFPAVQAAGLWPELKDSTAEQAVAHMSQRFSWHYRHLELGSIKVGGMTVLQFAPLALLPLFFGLIRRSRGLGATYNPFDRVSSMDHLPTVGFGSQALNLLVLVALPLLACVLCAWSLIQISQPPIVPALCAVATLGLGGSSHVALKELLDLREAITRSHSNPPPSA